VDALVHQSSKGHQQVMCPVRLVKENEISIKWLKLDFKRKQILNPWLTIASLIRSFPQPSSTFSNSFVT
jgi:hypothetical protein